MCCTPRIIPPWFCVPMPVCQQFRKDVRGVSIVRHRTVNGSDIIKLWLGSHDNDHEARQWLQNILDPTKYQDRLVYVHHKLTLNGASPKNFLPSVLAKGANTPFYMPTSLAPMRFSSSALPLFISFSFSDTPAPRISPLLSGLDCSLGIGQPLMAVIGGHQGTWPPRAVLCGTGNFLLGLLGIATAVVMWPDRCVFHSLSRCWSFATAMGKTSFLWEFVASCFVMVVGVGVVAAAVGGGL